ncbi:MAG TPA: universal stress protein [Acidobacteriaceae bacterium]
MPAIKDRVEVAVGKILLATDFSPVSTTAAAYARAIARRFSSTVLVTNVVDAPSEVAMAGVALAPDADELKRDSMTKLDTLMKEFAGIHTVAKVLDATTPAATALTQEARRTEADMIIMGTTSKRGVEKLLVGSTAESVIRNATCPVLTIGPNVRPPSEDPLAFHTILYATDFSAQAAKAAIYALSFAQDSAAHLYLCHVSKVGQTELADELPSERELEASLRRLIPPSAYDYCTPTCVVEHGHTPSALLGLAESIHADLIVLGSRKSSFWLQYIDTGLTPALLAGAKCPVLTVC